MTELAVIHVKANGLLLTIHNLVGHAWIIWVNLKTHGDQALRELTIVQ